MSPEDVNIVALTDGAGANIPHGKAFKMMDSTVAKLATQYMLPHDFSQNVLGSPSQAVQQARLISQPSSPAVAVVAPDSLGSNTHEVLLTLTKCVADLVGEVRGVKRSLEDLTSPPSSQY